jgi:hypothetical protein
MFVTLVEPFRMGTAFWYAGDAYHRLASSIEGGRLFRRVLLPPMKLPGVDIAISPIGRAVVSRGAALETLARTARS